jgi:hypothetical protein
VLEPKAARTVLLSLKALDPARTGVSTHADLYQVLRLVQVHHRSWSYDSRPTERARHISHPRVF